MILETVSANPESSPAAHSALDDVSFRLTLEQAPCAGQSFSVVFQVCANPCCPCQALALECAPTADPETPLCFDVDPFAHKLKPNWRSRTGPHDLALGHAFVAEATSEHWAWLERYFLSVKRSQMQALDLDQLHVEWPPEVAAGTATMVGYAEIFPWADAILFDHDGAAWAVDDQYCVRPDCTCVEAGLAFFQLPGTVSRSTRRRRTLLFLYYDYRTATFRVIEKTPRSPDPEHLLQALRTAKPDLDRTFDQRHQQLKQLSRRLLHPSVQHRRPSLSNFDDTAPPRRLIPPISPPVIRSPKIGRNDPCPCGSGKKYKKCCGAN